MNATTYGLDVAKHVFQMYWVDAQTGEIANQRFPPRRTDQLSHHVRHAYGFVRSRPRSRSAASLASTADSMTSSH
jgi:hypothetical protein